MNTLILAGLLTLAIMACIAALGNRFAHLRRAYYFGIATWSRWLPVLAVFAYSVILSANLASGTGSLNSLVQLGGVLSTSEIVLLFLLTPLLLTRAGSPTACAVVLFIVLRLMFGSTSSSASQGMLILIGASTLVAVLNDRMPWLSPTLFQSFAQRVRETLVSILSLGSAAITFATIVKVQGFAKWTNAVLGLSVAPSVLLILLFVLLLAWLTVFFGLTRHFSLPFICIPTLFAVSFVTQWPSYALVVPFVACLALSLTSAERRIVPVRSTNGATYVIQN